MRFAIALSLILIACDCFAQETVKVHVLDPSLKTEAAQSFSDQKHYQVVDNTEAPSTEDSIIGQSGLSKKTSAMDPYSKHMLILRARTLSIEKMKVTYPDFPDDSLKKLMELSHAK